MIETMEDMLSLPDWHKNRLEMIKLAVGGFWEQKRYFHFTNQGIYHSERVHRILSELVFELPHSKSLNPDEILILSAATFLYEIGMQSPDPMSVLSWDINYEDQTVHAQLKAIRTNRHLLSQKLILGNFSDQYRGSPISFGLSAPTDLYKILIAEVCRWCSDEPLANVPESDMVNGRPVRIRLLVALLRLADQLYIDDPRINLEALENANLPPRDFARWWSYHYASILPIQNGEINFRYALPLSQKGYLPQIRTLIESEFEFDNNLTLQYLSQEYHIRLLPPRKPIVSSHAAHDSLQLMDNHLVMYLYQNKDRLQTAVTHSVPVPSSDDSPKSHKPLADSGVQRQPVPLTNVHNTNTSDPGHPSHGLNSEKTVRSKFDQIRIVTIGAISFCALVFGTFFLSNLGTVAWISPLVNWLIRFSNPQLAHWLFSLSFASLLWLVIYSFMKIGGKVTIKSGGGIDFQSESINLNHPFVSIVFGIPAWVISILVILSSFGLYYLRPSCQIPTIAFQRIGENDLLTPNQIIRSEIGSSLILRVVDADNEAQVLRCKWNSNDESVASLEQLDSCVTTVYLSNTPGEGSITVWASRDFCDAHTTANINISTYP